MNARLIIRLLFGFASDFDKLNQSTKSETAMLSCLFQNYLVSVQCHVIVRKEEPAPFQDIVTPIKYINLYLLHLCVIAMCATLHMRFLRWPATLSRVKPAPMTCQCNVRPRNRNYYIGDW